MADHHKRPRRIPLLEPFFQVFDRFHIQVVCRFIEQEQVRLCQQHFRQLDTTPLAS